MGRVQAAVTAQKGRPTAIPGVRLPGPVQPAGPRPLEMVIRSLQAYDRARAQK